MTRPLYQGFLGTWILIPESCDYEQGPPPKTGTYTIKEVGDQLEFSMSWTDSEDKAHTASYSGVPDGRHTPFAGGDLADALSIEAVSERELTSAAHYRGVERMVAQRQLDERGEAMRVTQLVRLPSGESLANVSVYRRQQPLS